MKDHASTRRSTRTDTAHNAAAPASASPARVGPDRGLAQRLGNQGMQRLLAAARPAPEDGVQAISAEAVPPAATAQPPAGVAASGRADAPGNGSPRSRPRAPAGLLDACSAPHDEAGAERAADDAASLALAGPFSPPRQAFTARAPLADAAPSRHGLPGHAQRALAGSGEALPASLAARLSAPFGIDLGGVRVHQDSQSDALARGMTAKAFTTGSDVFLRQDQNAGDVSLMAHELTHVVQQSSDTEASGSGLTVGAAGDSHEQEADVVAAQISSGATDPKAREEDR